MKSVFIVLLSLITVIMGLTNEKTEKLKKWHMECFDETKTPPDLILKLTKGNWFIENGSLKKWIHCLLRKHDLMTKEGVFKLDSALSMVPQRDQTIMEDLIDECLPKKAGPAHEIAWHYAKCYHLQIVDRKNKNKNLHYLALLY